MSPGPRGPANWVWARGGTRLSVLHRWCETQPSLHTWNIQILPAASLWSCCNRQGKTERVGGRKQQKQEEEQHTWERTDWHFLRENKQSQVSCVAMAAARRFRWKWAIVLMAASVEPSSSPTNWPQWWSFTETSPPQFSPLFSVWKKQENKPCPQFFFFFLLKFKTVADLIFFYASPSKKFSFVFGALVVSRGLGYCKILSLLHVHVSNWADHLTDWGYHVFSKVSTH